MELSTMYWLHFVSQGAANVLVSGIWQGFVLAIGIGLILRLVPGVSATTRFTIWSVVFLVLALLPFVHIPHENIPHFVQAGAIPSASHPFFHLDVRWSFAITALWLIASLFRASSLSLHGFRLRALWRSATPVDAGLVSNDLLAGTGARRAQLCTSPDLDQPSVIGFLSPRILIPAWLFNRLTPTELEQIVLHEVEHLRRGDDWINLLQKLSLVLFPLNPVLVWIEGRLCFERELACDDGVVHATRAPRAYATCLTSLAEQNLDRRAASLALGAWGRRSAIAGRVHSILRRGDVLSPLQARSVTGAVVLALLLGAVGLSQCPQLVSFSVPAHPVGTLAVAHPAAVYPSALFHDVVFHASRAPSANLLKASLPARGGMRTAGSAVLNATTIAHRPGVRRSKTIQNGTQYWIVLTSWADSTNQDGMRPVMSNQPVLSPYAAVPTDGGWIIVQL